MAEQRYKAVLAVIGEGRTVTEVAQEWRVSRQTLHTWLARYEAGGLEALGDGSHRPAKCPHQMPAELEAMVLELRRYKPYWGPRSLISELARRKVSPLPSKSAVYRCLLRAGVIAPLRSRRRIETWKRWERGGPMELWQMDVVGGFLLADGTTAKALTGVDDHSRFCISAKLMLRERTQLVCDGFAAALRTYGVPEQVLTDNGKVFTANTRSRPSKCSSTGSVARTASSICSRSRATPRRRARSSASTALCGSSSTPRRCSGACPSLNRPWMRGSRTTTPHDRISHSPMPPPRAASG